MGRSAISNNVKSAENIADLEKRLKALQSEVKSVKQLIICSLLKTVLVSLFSIMLVNEKSRFNTISRPRVAKTGGQCECFVTDTTNILIQSSRSINSNGTTHRIENAYEI